MARKLLTIDKVLVTGKIAELKRILRHANQRDKDCLRASIRKLQTLLRETKKGDK